MQIRIAILLFFQVHFYASASTVTFEELPLLRGLHISASSADGHVVAGSGRIDCCLEQAFRWDGSGEVLHLATPAGQQETYVKDISADGSIVLIEARSQDIAVTSGYRWLQNGSLAAITSETIPHAVTTISADGNQVAGRTFHRENASLETPFIWSPQKGNQTLQLPKGMNSADPVFFSDDGQTLYGVGYTDNRVSDATYSAFEDSVSIRWLNGKLDTKASALPLISGTRGYLLTLTELEILDLQIPYPELMGELGKEGMRVDWVSADGELILGKGELSNKELIWTRANGICQLSNWLDALGVVYPRDARHEGSLSSPDGRTLFGVSYRATDEKPITPWRVVADQPLGQLQVSSGVYCTTST